MKWISMIAQALVCGVLLFLYVDQSRRITAIEQSQPQAAPNDHLAELRAELSAMELDLACERLNNLPQDAGNWHTSLIVQPDWQTRRAEKRAVEAFDTEPHLRALKGKTHFHFLKTDDPIYQRDFAKECPLTPCLLITRADGTVIYKESGGQLGARPAQLYGSIRAEIRRHCPDGRCLPPLRFPDQPPDAAPIKEEIPDTISPEKAPEGVAPIVGMAIAGGVSALAFLLISFLGKERRVRAAMSR